MVKKTNRINRPGRLTLQFVKSKFLELGIELLEDDYCNNHTSMSCRCANGHLFKTTYNRVCRGSGCPTCNFRKRPQSQLKYSLQEVEEIFLLYGCKLLSSYRKVEDKLRYKCACGKESTTNIVSFQKAKRCASCAKKKENNPAWIKDREAVTTKKIFGQRCRWLVKNTLKSIGVKKTSRTKDILGYSGEELRVHITSHCNWGKLKNKSWHIDHIFPVKAFIENGITDLKIINCLSNLRPTLKSYNLQKNSKYDISAFKKWIKKNWPEIIL